MTDNYLLKMELVNEYKRALGLIEVNKEIGEIFLSTLKWLNEYSETNHMPLPTPKERILKAMDKMESLFRESDESYQREDSDAELPEPRLTD